MSTVSIQDLKKVYRSTDSPIVAVEGLDISIEDGEFLVLVGPSGCGKSTTLRCIAGLETVTEGEITFDGKPVTDDKPKDRDIAMVFQNYALYPHFTARENMAFGLKMTTELSDAQIRPKVEEVAQMMGIEDLLEKQPGELSGGQQQRVALGRAIVRDPKVFLMDEPLSNLDAKLRSEMRTELQNLQEQLGVTTVYVTHDQTEAMTMGDRVAVLNDGELQQIGTPLECYHEPENIFVAGFIGSPEMNRLDVRLDGDRLVDEELSYRILEGTAKRINSSELTLGIRPEHIRVSDDQANADLTAGVSVVEPMGQQTNLYLEFGSETFTATVTGETMFESGDTVGIEFPHESVHLFDRATGEALVHGMEQATSPDQTA
ncbi:sn-glycerol-3-phosphate ABC transporter ATP-binding protein UgpC [Halostella sp. PRR32]|uniref:ABC transporter ATP-binding protein n=1 Tax=Halostella sp. PRR32 TaxID=3098147 RepID=UPI002B1D9EF0|nr:sn-glycerol-3-phosphate ABC transporter ATP-binding protein UgpC [Halostella sp. PRR32]